MTVNEHQTFSASANRAVHAEETDPKRVERTSSIIARLAQEKQGQSVSVGEIVTALKDRGFGVLMILFSLPNAVIPGISWLLGTPIILFGLQIALGGQRVWLPKLMLDRRISASLFQTIATRVEQFLARIEKWLKPRWLFLFSGVGERLLGLCLALFAIVLMAPIPFGNWFPALGISLISIGIIEKDGVAAMIGVLLGILGTIFIAAVVIGGVTAGLNFLDWMSAS